MNVLRSGVRVARELQSTEKAVDNAMLAASGLIQAMLIARDEANVAAEVGHQQLTEVVAGLGHLNEVRGLVVRAHTGLATVADAGGIGWKMDGPYERKLEPSAVLKVA